MMRWADKVTLLVFLRTIKDTEEGEKERKKKGGRIEDKRMGGGGLRVL
jgi:hypothetical protein